MNWREAHEEAMFAAAEAHEHLALDPRRPIDVFAAIRGAGLELIFRPLRGVSGLYLPAAPGLSGGVLVSSHHPLARQRLTAAHEFGHHWLGHEASVDPLTNPDTAAAALAPTEMVAEAFAAWFMMPPELADSALAEMGLERPRSPAEVYALALRMGTSYQATLAQLPNLHLASAGEARRWAGLPAKAIKEELSRGVPMRSYRNDIHLLGGAETPRRVGPGDRLLVPAGSTGAPPLLPPGAELRAEWQDLPIAGIGRVERILVIDLDERTEGTFELRATAAGGGDARFVLEIAGPELGRERDPLEAKVPNSSTERLQGRHCDRRRPSDPRRQRIARLGRRGSRLARYWSPVSGGQPFDSYRRPSGRGRSPALLGRESGGALGAAGSSRGSEHDLPR